MRSSLAELAPESTGLKIRITTAATLAVLTAGAVYLLIGLYAPEPTTLCASAGSPGGFTKCEESQACEYILQGKPAQIKFDYDNWTQQYNMVCENAGKRQFAKSLFLFVSYCAAGLLISLTELFGIKKLVTLTALLAIGGTGIGTFVDDYTMKLLMYGIAGAGPLVYASLFTIAFSELLPSESTPDGKLLPLVFAANPLGILLFSMVFTFVTTSPTVLAWITLVTTVITSFLPVIVMPESPIYLLRKNKIPEFCQVIKDIRDQDPNLSKVPQSELQQKAQELATEHAPLIETEAERSLSKQISVFSSQYIGLLLSMTLLVTVSTIIFLALGLNLNLLGTGSPGLNSVIYYGVGSGSGLCYLGIRRYFKTRKWLMILIGMQLFGGVLLVVFGKMGLLEGQNTGQKLLNLFITVGIIGVPSFMIFAPTFAHLSELFPEQIVGTASSLVLLISNIIGSATPQLASYSKEHTPHFAILSSALTIIPLITLSFHKDTR